MKAFLTGSRIYGTPTKDSDVDLVVYCEHEDQLKLIDFDEVDQNSSARPSADCSVRFGKLNLIFVQSEKEHAAWLSARSRCLAEGPVSKRRACQIHDEERERGKKMKKEEDPLIERWAAALADFCKIPISEARILAGNPHTTIGVIHARAIVKTLGKKE